jgi:hypothetical protein
MDPVIVDAFNIRSYAVGARTPFGALCQWSSEKIVKPTATGTLYSYVGLAVDDMVEKTVDGFYSQYDAAPLIIAGIGRAWLLGGVTADAGDYLKIAATLGAGSEFLGVLDAEADVTRTLYSVAKVVGDDVGDAEHDQTVSSISAKELTIDSAAHLTSLGLVKGDYVVVDSDEAAEVNRIDDPAISTTECSVQLDPNASHANSIKIYKLTQAEVLLI